MANPISVVQTAIEQVRLAARMFRPRWRRKATAQLSITTAWAERTLNPSRAPRRANASQANTASARESRMARCADGPGRSCSASPSIIDDPQEGSPCRRRRKSIREKHSQNRKAYFGQIRPLVAASPIPTRRLTVVAAGRRSWSHVTNDRQGVSTILNGSVRRRLGGAPAGQWSAASIRVDISAGRRLAAPRELRRDSRHPVNQPIHQTDRCTPEEPQCLTM